MTLQTIAVRFDKNSPLWAKEPGYNVALLTSHQLWANSCLQKMGSLFLNEVFDLLRLPRTSEGQTSGWLMSSDQSYVDFGFSHDSEFVAGYNTDVTLHLEMLENAHLLI